jgi:hypothetical protein
VRVLAAALVVCPAVLSAQLPPRDFGEFAGPWVLDEGAGRGRLAWGLPLVRTLTIATAPTQVTVRKDGGPAEIYRVDGSETALGDGRRASLALVSEALALTTKRTRTREGQSRTNIITDAYAVAGDVLTIERRASILWEPPGTLTFLGKDPQNSRQTLVYRRAPAPRGP